MSIGLPADKATVDGRSGNIVWQLRELLNNVQTFKAWLDTKQDTDLTTLGYSSAEVTLLRASFTDLDKLRQVAHGQATQSPASDFFFNASKLTGTQ